MASRPVLLLVLAAGTEISLYGDEGPDYTKLFEIIPSRDMAIGKLAVPLATKALDIP
jgi:hypothetical protein